MYITEYAIPFLSVYIISGKTEDKVNNVHYFEDFLDSYRLPVPYKLEAVSVDFPLVSRIVTQVCCQRLLNLQYSYIKW
jgi:hypothetical protein